MLGNTRVEIGTSDRLGVTAHGASDILLHGVRHGENLLEGGGLSAVDLKLTDENISIVTFAVIALNSATFGLWLGCLLAEACFGNVPLRVGTEDDAGALDGAVNSLLLVLARHHLLERQLIVLEVVVLTKENFTFADAVFVFFGAPHNLDRVVLVEAAEVD